MQLYEKSKGFFILLNKKDFSVDNKHQWPPVIVRYNLICYDMHAFSIEFMSVKVHKNVINQQQLNCSINKNMNLKSLQSKMTLQNEDNRIYLIRHSCVQLRRLLVGQIILLSNKNLQIAILSLLLITSSLFSLSAVDRSLCTKSGQDCSYQLGQTHKRYLGKKCRKPIQAKTDFLSFFLQNDENGYLSTQFEQSEDVTFPVIKISNVI